MLLPAPMSSGKCALHRTISVNYAAFEDRYPTHRLKSATVIDSQARTKRDVSSTNFNRMCATSLVDADAGTLSLLMGATILGAQLGTSVVQFCSAPRSALARSSVAVGASLMSLPVDSVDVSSFGNAALSSVCKMRASSADSGTRSRSTSIGGAHITLVGNVLPTNRSVRMTVVSSQRLHLAPRRPMPTVQRRTPQ